MSESRQFKAIVGGRVQGVCYRASVQERGRELGLAGYARNLPDGSVEVVAAGSRDRLESLIGFLRIGPSAAIVEAIEVDWEDMSEAPEPFAIRW